MMVQLHHQSLEDTENMKKFGCTWGCEIRARCPNGQKCECPDCQNSWFWHDRRLVVKTHDEYGTPKKFILNLPIFFHNRPNTKLASIEIIDKNDKVVDTISRSDEAIKTNVKLQEILTMHDLMKS